MAEQSQQQQQEQQQPLVRSVVTPPTTVKSKPVGFRAALIKKAPVPEKARKERKERKERKAPTTTEPAKPHRWRPGTKAMRDVAKAQKGVEYLIRRLPFQRLVREIAQDFKEGLRFQQAAIDALQDASEDMVVNLIKPSYSLSLMDGRQTLMAKDYRNHKIMAAQAKGAGGRSHVIAPKMKPKAPKKRKSANSKKE